MVTQYTPVTLGISSKVVLGVEAGTWSNHSTDLGLQGGVRKVLCCPEMTLLLYNVTCPFWTFGSGGLTVVSLIYFFLSHLVLCISLFLHFAFAFNHDANVVSWTSRPVYRGCWHEQLLNLWQPRPFLVKLCDDSTYCHSNPDYFAGKDFPGIGKKKNSCSPASRGETQQLF